MGHAQTVSDASLLRVQHFTNLVKSLTPGFDCSNKIKKPEYSRKNRLDQILRDIDLMHSPM